MQEDKQLKELLTKCAVQHPSVNFTSGVMQRITAAYASNAHTPPLHKQRVPQMLLGLFILVCILLLVLSLAIPTAAVPFQFTVKLPARYFTQGISFFVAFWIVMFLNLVSKKYSAKVI